MEEARTDSGSAMGGAAFQPGPEPAQEEEDLRSKRLSVDWYGNLAADQHAPPPSAAAPVVAHLPPTAEVDEEPEPATPVPDIHVNDVKEEVAAEEAADDPMEDIDQTVGE
jgi:hypothetical protein